MASLFLHLANQNKMLESPTIRPQTTLKSLHGAEHSQERMGRLPAYGDGSGHRHKEDAKERPRIQDQKRDLRTIGIQRDQYTDSIRSVDENRVGVSGIKMGGKTPGGNCITIQRDTPYSVQLDANKSLMQNPEERKIIESESRQDIRQNIANQASVSGKPLILVDLRFVE